MALHKLVRCGLQVSQCWACLDWPMRALPNDQTDCEQLKLDTSLLPHSVAPSVSSFNSMIGQHSHCKLVDNAIR